MSNTYFELQVNHNMQPEDLLAATTSICQAVADMPASSHSHTKVSFQEDYGLHIGDYYRTHPNAGIEVPRPVRGYMHKLHELGHQAIRNASIEPFASYPDLVTMEQVCDIMPGTAEWLWQSVNRAANQPLRGGRVNLLRAQTAEEAPSTVVGIHTALSLHELATRLVLKPEDFAVDPRNTDMTAAGATLLLLVGREAHRNERRETPIDMDHPKLRELRDWKTAIYEEFDSINRLESVDDHAIEALKERGYHRLSHLVHALGSTPQRPHGVNTKSRQSIWREVQHVLPDVRRDIIRAMTDAAPTTELTLAS